MFWSRMKKHERNWYGQYIENIFRIYSSWYTVKCKSLCLVYRSTSWEHISWNFSKHFSRTFYYIRISIYIAVYKETYQKHPFHFKNMSQQRKSNSLKTKRSAILHFWNNGHRSPATISRITKTPLRTVKYNIRKIKQ